MNFFYKNKRALFIIRMQRLKSISKEDEDEEKKRRMKDIVVLCINHLISQGYIDAAERLAQESGIPSDKYELCDNINLLQVMIDFESFQELKYGQKPKIYKLLKKEMDFS